MELELSQEATRARRFGRVPFDAPVRLTRHSTGQTLELSGVNLSENGLFVETVIPFAIGELFRLSFGEVEVAAARVAWRRPYLQPRSAASPPGIGLMFLLMHPSDRAALRGLVESGGIAPSPKPRTIPSRVAPVANAPHPPPQMRWQLAGGEAEMLDVGPVGWLLALALAMAAVASLLVGLHPIPV